MSAPVEDFERCSACGQGMEPRVVGEHLETVEEAIQLGDPSTTAVMVCPNPECPAKQTPEHAGTL